MAAHAAAMAGAMGAAGRRRRRGHAAHHARGLHPLHAAGRAAVLDGQRPRRRLHDADLPQHSDRSVDGAGGAAAAAREQALGFALERSELERQALDARLHLLQAQVAPHFLFNTLANVQALVDAGSPHASAVLRSLTAYLRAAVPVLHEPGATIERELQLVRPYLELMQMRMPDRLEYTINVDPAALTVCCPPTMVLTLV